MAACSALGAIAGGANPMLAKGHRDLVLLPPVTPSPQSARPGHHRFAKQDIPTEPVAGQSVRAPSRALGCSRDDVDKDCNAISSMTSWTSLSHKGKRGEQPPTPRADSAASHQLPACPQCGCTALAAPQKPMMRSVETQTDVSIVEEAPFSSMKDFLASTPRTPIVSLQPSQHSKVLPTLHHLGASKTRAHDAPASVHSASDVSDKIDRGDCIKESVVAVDRAKPFLSNDELSPCSNGSFSPSSKLQERSGEDSSTRASTLEPNDAGSVGLVDTPRSHSIALGDTPRSQSRTRRSEMSKFGKSRLSGLQGVLPSAELVDTLTLRQWFNELDAEQNGHVTKTSYIKTLRENSALRQYVVKFAPDLRASFEGNGVQLAMQLRQCLQLWKDIDTDRSDTLEWEEFVDFFRRAGRLFDEYEGSDNPRVKIANLLGELHSCKAGEDSEVLVELETLTKKHVSTSAFRRRSITNTSADQQQEASDPRKSPHLWAVVCGKTNSARA